MKVPAEITKKGAEGLEIIWQNGEKTFLSSKTLRDNCPAADSKALRGDTSHDKPLSPKKKSLMVVEHTLEESIALQDIWKVGNYGIGIRWKDGHDNGIYTFDFLYELSVGS